MSKPKISKLPDGRKEQIKQLCEGKPKLEWWAMVLFAEIAEMIQYYENNRISSAEDNKVLVGQISAKIREFDRLTINHATVEAGESETFEERVDVLENKVETLKKRIDRLESDNPRVGA